ncbi:hypothetical protein [Bacillus taeanensis]|uniref:Uncharacterized protein n=1 Tax=Bacillus taeanensis TaxID=273032 RepID=A0A366XTK5_9BACI|nr:hypothetical protein [Bacillus taeanensis]RBW67484.1 hypothetical protein DS031_22020 [Bacillus taeanensis]
MLMEFFNEYQITTADKVYLKVSKDVITIEKLVWELDKIEEQQELINKIDALGNQVDKEMVLAYLSGIADMIKLRKKRIAN